MACLVSDLAAAWVLHLLHKYPTPDKLGRAKDASLQAIPHLSLEKADPLRALAKNTIGTLTGEVAEELVRTLVGQLQQSKAAKARLEKLLVQAYHALPLSNPIASIPGIGDATAAVLTAKIVDINRFPSADPLVAYFGIFPEEHSSGVDRFGKPLPPGTMHMSRQGNDLVRKYLWNAAMSAVQCNPAARALYRRLLARGTRPSVAIGQVMRKLLHLVFAISKTGKPFDPQHYPWEKPDAQEQVAGRNRAQRPGNQAVTATLLTRNLWTLAVRAQRPGNQAVTATGPSTVMPLTCCVNAPGSQPTPKAPTSRTLTTTENSHVLSLEENQGECTRSAPSDRSPRRKRKTP